MARYRVFRDYLTTSGRNDIKAWLAKLTPGERQAIQAAIRGLEQVTNPSNSHFPAIGDGLHKIRLTHRGVQLRPLCLVSVERGEVVILVGAKERDGEFHPAGILEVAKKRRAEVVADWEGRSCEHEFD